jgi:hypothetical protein
MSNVTSIRSPELVQREFLHSYPDRYLACRDRHAWPQLKTGRYTGTRQRLIPIPEEQAQGSYLLEQRCGSCGRLRWRVTGPHGVGYSAASGWHYRDPAGYAAPKGMGLTRGQFLDELYRRVVEQFEAEQRTPAGV